jgi:hypothetical protein
MEMKQLEAMGQLLCLEHFSRGQQLGRCETELGVFTAALCPFAGAFAQETASNSDQWLNSDLSRYRQNLFQLFELLDDHDHCFAQLDSH